MLEANALRGVHQTLKMFTEKHWVTVHDTNVFVHAKSVRKFDRRHGHVCVFERNQLAVFTAEIGCHILILTFSLCKRRKGFYDVSNLSLFSSMKKSMNWTAYAAELVGTFLLALIVYVSLSGVAGGVPTAILAGLLLGTMVYVLGPVSGAHLNPAQTIALWSAKKISAQDGICYIVAQFLGAYLAMKAGMAMGGMVMLSVHDTMTVAIAEALGAAVLLLGVSGVVWKKVPGDASGLVIGTSLSLGAILASAGGNGILNPAVALALGSFSVVYVLGPIVGACAGVWLYKWLLS